LLAPVRVGILRAMSLEDVEVVRQWVRVYNSGGLDAVIDTYWHDRIELVEPAGLPDADRYVGKEAVRPKIESYFEIGWDGQFRVEELIDAGEEVVMVWRMLGRAPGSRIPLDFSVAFVLLLEGGRLRRIRWCLSREEALEAAGVRQ
jgi:ketosteroid isomerase-like protein